MNRSDLIAAIAADMQIPKNQVDRFLDSFVDVVQSSVAAGKTVKIFGFGQFDYARVTPRPFRNPKTGESVMLTERLRPRFTAGQGFRDAVAKASGDTP